MRYDNEQIQNATENLTAWLKPGSTVYTSVKQVARSGMSRHISLYIVRNGEIYDITYYVGVLGEHKHDPTTGGLVVGGCGMDMGFHTVYGLSRRLFANGFKCVGNDCRSNDHTNGDCPSRAEFKGKKHKGDSGYALNHRWI